MSDEKKKERGVKQDAIKFKKKSRNKNKDERKRI